MLSLTTPGAHLQGCVPRRNMRRGAHGFTLIEVMVSLAILVIGAIAIIRIFPASLGLVQTSGDRSVASRINSTDLSTFASNPDLVPDGIYNVAAGAVPIAYAATMPFAALPLDDSYLGAFVGNRNVNNALPDTVQSPDIQRSALGHFRYVKGEKHTVQSRYFKKTDGTVVSVSFFTTRYPYSSSVSVWQEGIIKGVKLRGNVAGNKGVLDFTDATDSSGNSFSDTRPVGNPMRPPITARTPGGTIYYVSYRWREDLRTPNSTDKAIQGVIDEPVCFPDDGGYGTLPSAQVFQAQRASGLNPPATIFDQDVTVHYRHMVDMVPDNGGTTSIDPVPAPGTGTTTTAQGSVGYVPCAVPSQTDPNTPVNLLQPGDKISVDYQVSDWSQLVEDGQPTLNTLRPVDFPGASEREAVVQLPVKNINDDQPTILSSLYMVPQIDNPNGMTYFTSDSISATSPNPDRTNPDKQGPDKAVNIPGSIQYVDPGGSTPPGSNVTTTNIQNGRIAFNATQDASLAGSPVTRVVYRTLDQWHHQVSVAAKSYLPFYENETFPFADATKFNPRERWREYYLEVGTATEPKANIAFHTSEAGKTVLVTYAYDDGSGYKIVYDSVVTIGEDLSENGITFPGPGGAKGVRCVLSLPNGKVIGADVPATYLKAVLAVKGASIQSRTAWTVGTHFEQSVLSSYRGSLKQESSQ